jgi:hypothetical protein
MEFGILEIRNRLNVLAKDTFSIDHQDLIIIVLNSLSSSASPQHILERERESGTAHILL